LDLAVDSTVDLLRTEARRNPFDRNLSDLIGELSTRSETFRKRWAAHNVRLHRTGRKRYHRPVVGELSLDYDTMEFPADTGLTLTAYSAQPGTPSHDGLVRGHEKVRLVCRFTRSLTVLLQDMLDARCFRTC
jgi:MmyB-like transcription regulator ligand binding domain